MERWCGGVCLHSLLIFKEQHATTLHTVPVRCDASCTSNAVPYSYVDCQLAPCTVRVYIIMDFIARRCWHYSVTFWAMLHCLATLRFRFKFKMTLLKCRRFLSETCKRTMQLLDSTECKAFWLQRSSLVANLKCNLWQLHCSVRFLLDNHLPLSTLSNEPLQHQTLYCLVNGLAKRVRVCEVCKQLNKQITSLIPLLAVCCHNM